LYRLHRELCGILRRFETDDEAWDNKALNARLARPDIGIESGDREDDVPCVYAANR
jgi:hypothetical protein